MNVRFAVPILVGIGDIVVLCAFSIVGLLSHGVDPRLVPWHTFMIALPFVIAWLLVAPLGGLYAVQTMRSLRATLLWTTTAWVGTTLLGGLIRATPVFPGEAPPSFLLVTLGFGLLLVVPWRVAVWGLVRRLS